MIRLDDKVAIVTGAGRGLGRAYALALARAGARVVVNDLGVQLDGSAPGDNSAGAVVAEIRRAGGHAVANPDSVIDEHAVKRLIESTLTLFGRLDILVNNAGIVRSRPLSDMPEADWQAVLDVHLTGTFLCSQAAFRALRDQGRGGRIINTTSGAAFAEAYPATANYAAAKAGIIALTRVTAAEGGPHGITCNAIAPGVTLTERVEPIWTARSEEQRQSVLANIPLGRMPRAEDQARVIAFLASRDADFVNGTTIDVAGGQR